MSIKLLFLSIFVALILAVSLLGYRLWYQAPKPSTTATETGVVAQGFLSGSTAPANATDAEYARLLRVIGAITDIDRSIFSNPAFRTLINFSIVIPNPTPGRANPFAPVGAP